MHTFKASPDPAGASLLIAAFGWKNARDINQAFEIYETLKSRSTPNVAVYGSLINACRKCNQPTRALHLLEEMKRFDVTPNEMCFGSLTAACSETGDANKATQLVELWQKGLSFQRPDVYCVQLIDTFSKSSNVQSAFDVYKLYCKSATPTLSIFGALVNACHKDKHYGKLLALWDEMHRYHILPDKVCFGMFTHACAEIGNVHVASKILDALQFKQLPFNANPIDCAQLIQAFESSTENALKVLEYMDREGVVPNAHAYATLLKICGKKVSLTSGKRVIEHINKTGMQDLIVHSAIISMYGKTGTWQSAITHFEYMKANFRTLDLAVHNTVLSVYAHHGQAQKAFLHFNAMLTEQLIPNSTTFVILLNACSHQSLVNEALAIFDSMSHHGVTPSLLHYNCLIDVLGRAGCKSIT